MKKKIIMYWHAGSGNHGCEAIVRSTCRIIGGEYEYVVYSRNPEEDYKYINENIKNLSFKQGENKIKTFSLLHLYLLLKKLVKKNDSHYYDWIFKPTYSEKNSLALSIGGDIYCSEGAPKLMGILNEKLRQNNETILWGCSIEPNVLNNLDVVQELQGYKLIIARESITYKALIDKGLYEKTILYPDPAFTLPSVNLPLPEDFQDGDIIGINASPSVESRASNQDIVYNNYRNLIKYILSSSTNKVMLVPHVVWKNNSDYSILNRLYEEFENTNRIYLIQDCNCMELKGYIARCRMFVGARTHSTIAAYSSCVPTIVIGYSVKSRGIAKDIFGTEKNYVLPVQNMCSDNDLTLNYQWLENNEEEIRRHLNNIMPHYIDESWKAGNEIKRYMEN